MNTALMEKHTDPWYKHGWPWLLMVGPATVIVAGLITIWISFAGADPLVVDDYYKQGKAINQDLRRDRVAANLGLSLSLRYDAAAGALTGQLHGSNDDAPLNLLLAHPTVPGKDIHLGVRPDRAGIFSVALPLLERTHWQVQIEDAARSWRLHGEWSWPQQKSTDIKPLSDKR
jgi:hypothetical protein